MNSSLERTEIVFDEKYVQIKSCIKQEPADFGDDVNGVQESNPNSVWIKCEYGEMNNEDTEIGCGNEDTCKPETITYDSSFFKAEEIKCEENVNEHLDDEIKTDVEIFTDYIVSSDELDTENCPESNESVQWYQCKFCDHRTRFKSVLRRHFKIQHDNYTELYQCQFCEYRTKRNDDYIRHFLMRHDKKAEFYHCQLCDYKTKGKMYLDQHNKYKHTPIELYRCEFCDFSAKRKGDLKRHFQNKHDEKPECFQCDLCNYISKEKRHIIQHYKNEHSVDINVDMEKYHCPLCEYTTDRRKCLTEHFRTDHEGKSEWYQCYMCKYKTKVKSYIFTHSRRTHVKNFDKESVSLSSIQYIRIKTDDKAETAE